MIFCKKVEEKQPEKEPEGMFFVAEKESGYIIQERSQSCIGTSISVDKKFTTLSEAKKRAESLSFKSPGTQYVVLGVIGTVVSTPNPPVWNI